MRGGAADKGVVPEVAIARVTGGETMVHDTQPGVVGGGPERFQTRMVDGHALGQVGMDAGGPWRARPGFDLLHRLIDRSAAHDDERFQTARKLAAEFLGKAVVGPDKADLN